MIKYNNANALLRKVVLFIKMLLLLTISTNIFQILKTKLKYKNLLFIGFLEELLFFTKFKSIKHQGRQQKKQQEQDQEYKFLRNRLNWKGLQGRLK